VDELKIPDKWHGTLAQVRAGLFREQDGGPTVEMLIEEIARLEDSRFELASAHTEDTLTIERLTAENVALKAQVEVMSAVEVSAQNLADATDGEIIDSLQEDVGILSHRIFDLERDLAEANDQYVLLTDELWAVLGSEDRRDYVVQVKELVAELADARKAAEWQEITPENLPKVTFGNGWRGLITDGKVVLLAYLFVSLYDALTDTKTLSWNYSDHNASGTLPFEWATHFSHINPPSPEEPSK
jgi:hypothetical protein